MRSLALLVALAQIFTNPNSSDLDKTAPTVTIAVPTSSSSYDNGTSATLTTLSGTSSDATGVSICRWSNSAGGSGTATTSADGSWTVSSIALTVGTNTITVTCLDPGNNSGTDVLSVTRTSSSSGRGLYLKGDCTFNGTGLAANCAASAGASGAWNSVANANTGWAAICAAGDTLYIRAYDDNTTEHIADGNSDNARWHGGLRAQCAGTVSSYIAITNYPGEIGRIANGPVGCTTQQCDNATISTGERNYIRIGSTDGLYNTSGRLVVRGMIGLHGTSNTSRAQGLIVSGVEATTGWDEDGNWSPFRLEYTDGAHIHHNYIHDVTLTDGGAAYCAADPPNRCNASSGTGIKMFTAPDSVIEYNTIQRACVLHNCGTNGNFASQAGGIDDKADAVRSIYRYNYIEDVNVCIRIQNQSSGAFSSSTGTQTYGNVCARVGTVVDGADHGAFVTEAGPITDLLIHHNTFSGFGINLNLKGFITAGGLTWRDNVVAAVSGGSPANRNIWDDGSSFTLAGFNTATNYNAYDSDADYQTDGTSTTIAAWRTALGGGRESASHESSTTCGTAFTSGTDTNFHIDSASVCKTSSSTGGEQGAYGVASCVGHLCTN